jgi:anti-anti-sigma regulatory factor
MPGPSHGAGPTLSVRWSGRQAVAVLPGQIDVAAVGPVREELLTVINRGAAVLVVDMTATVSCDYARTDALVRGYQRAVADGTELRLVVPRRRSGG